MRSSRFLAPLLALLSAQTALAQAKSTSENPSAPTGKNAAGARAASAPASGGDRVPDPAAAPDPAPGPATPASTSRGALPTTGAIAPPPENKVGPGRTLLPVPGRPEVQYPTTARVAITEFQVTGEEASRALAMRLQDGFVVGINRAAPIYAMDSVDVARYIDIFPELQKCQGSICIKRLGQLLDVSHILRVTVAVTGNSYDMTARLFSTDGLSPADVPIDTQTRFCPVCTVDEARQKVIQLGDAIKNPVEVWLAQQRPPPPPPPPAPSWRRPLAAASMALGFAAIVAGGALVANANPGTRAWPALGGALIGLGASVAAGSLYVLIAVPTDPGKSPSKIAVAGSF